MSKEMAVGPVDGVDLWILPWDYPFHITNFIYLANAKDNFYLVKDSGSSDFVENLEISSAFKVEKVNKQNLNIKSNSHTIFFTEQKPSSTEITNLKKNFQNVAFVYVNLGKKEASFFDVDNKKWSESVKFFTTDENKEQLYGIIFSDDADVFECNINRATERAKVVAKIYSKRAELLNQIDRRPDCHYNGIAGTLDQYSKGDISLVESIASQNLAGAGCIWVF